MTNSKKIIVVVLLFIVLKLAFRSMNNDDLQFLLYPTNFGVELATNSIASYLPQSAYFHSALNIVIDKSCSGSNFLLISFLLSVYALNRINGMKFGFVVAIAAISAYVLTIFANISRILSYLVLLNQDIPSHIDPENIWLHRAEGILVYLSFLILSFFVLNFVTNKLNNRHEELSKS